VLGVDAPVGAYSVGASALMPAPSNPVEVAWYDLNEFPGMGGAPGEGRNAIFSGHVDYAARVPYAGGVSYRGTAVFASLALLSPGDVIEVVYGGEVLRYQVKWRRQLAANSDGWAEIWSDQVPRDSITLYTCGGDFDFARRAYLDRVVVRAERM
jgi:sortase (surface protein transpeptidase)